MQEELIADARSYLSSRLGGNDMSAIPAEAVRVAIEKLYAGGWAAYEADFKRFVADQSKISTPEEYSPIKKLAIVQAILKIRLGEYDEIVKFDFDPNATAIFVISRASKIDRRARRDIVTEREITLYRLTRQTGGWKNEEVSITEAVHEIHHRFGAVNTAERHADKKEQFENCYRPGTSKTPLAGWVARLELSWKQAHENEEFHK